jgi:hypothetical protein
LEGGIGRAKEVAELFVPGIDHEQAGAELGINEITARAHRSERMQARSFAELTAAQAASLGKASNRPGPRCAPGLPLAAASVAELPHPL